MTTETTQHYAAITAHDGLVIYGIGESEEAALAHAMRCGGDESDFEVHPCAEYVYRHCVEHGHSDDGPEIEFDDGITIHFEEPDPADAKFRVCDDGMGEIYCSTEAQALWEMEHWLDDWENDEPSTSWVQVNVYELIDGEWDGIAGDTYTIEPAVPECEGGGEHWWADDWRVVGGSKDSPGIWSHGGGVRIHEFCRRCGCLRLEDTWATNPSTGEQGLRSIEYDPHHYAALAWRRDGESAAAVADARDDLERGYALLEEAGVLATHEYDRMEDAASVLGIDSDDYCAERRAVEDSWMSTYDSDETILPLQDEVRAEQQS